MTDAKFFHLGQFFSLRALITTVIGVGLIAVTEFVLPWLELLNIPAIQQWLSPATIVFTLAVIMVCSAVAKNIVSSIFLAVAAILSFYNPYETAAAYGNLFNAGYWAIIVMYLMTALLSGLFATVEMTGRTALLWIGIIYGLQGLIGAGTSMYLSFGLAHEAFQNAGFGIAFGESVGGFPVYDTVVGIFSIIYMIVFIIISRKRVSTTVTSNKHEIFGQIVVFLSIAAGLVFMILMKVFGFTYTQTDAAIIYGQTNVEFMNMIFQKLPSGDFTFVKYLNIFYILPIVGFAMGIGMGIMVYKRAQGTTDRMRFNFEGSFLWLNLVPLIITLLLSNVVILGLDAGATFYLNLPVVFAIFTEYTFLLLINLFVAYIIFRIIAFFKSISKK